MRPVKKSSLPPLKVVESAAALTYADAAYLHHSMNWTVLDAQWFTSGNSRLWKLHDTSFFLQTLPDPTLSILYRYFLNHPDECFLPKMPKLEDVRLKIKDKCNYDLSARDLGVLVGCNPITGYTWMQEGAGISGPTLRVISLMDQAVTLRGEAGFHGFLRIVLAEAASRGISEDTLWEKGWGAGQPTVDSVDSGIMDIVRRMCKLSVIDALWTGGTLSSNERTTFGSDREQPIENPTTAILWRYLLEHPQDHPLPNMPEAQDIADALESVMSKEMRGGTYRKRRISQLLGCTGISGYNWLAGSEGMSGIVKRLGLALVNAIAIDGREGFDRFLDCVEAEATSRGIQSLKNLFRGDWKTRNKRAESLPAE